MTPEEILKVEKEIVLTLKNIYDPEIPVNIYDLGLVYEIDYTPDGVANIRMTLLSHTGSNVRITLTDFTPATLPTWMLTSSTSMSAIGQLGAVSVMRIVATPSGV